VSSVPATLCSKRPDAKLDSRPSPLRDHARTLSDSLVPTLSTECEPCGLRGRNNVARLIEKYGDAKLPELRHILANCRKAKSFSVHDRCRVRYGEVSRLS
jgi:hypothetical protein